MKYSKTNLFPAAFATILILLAPSAFAGMISVTQQGLDVTVSWDIDGQDINFTYEADFTSAESNWIGAIADSFSVQLGDNGNNASMIDSFTSELKKADGTTDANGTWTGYKDKVSGQGCTAGTSDAICYTVNPTASGADDGQVIASAVYSWEFTVTLSNLFDPEQVMSGIHSIKFLAMKEGNERNPWTVAGQLSQDGTSVPEPGTLSLLGAGLVGFGLLSRKRRSAR